MIDAATSTTSATDVLPDLPPEARVWIYAASRDLTPEEVDIIRDALTGFLKSWSSHGRDVYGQVDVVDQRFLLVGAHIPSGDISGCGIDKSTRVVAELAERLGIEWLSALNVFYREGEHVRAVSRADFRALVREGSAGASTLVYDLTIEDVRALRNGRFLRMASDTWHARAFRIASA